MENKMKKEYEIYYESKSMERNASFDIEYIYAENPEEAREKMLSSGRKCLDIISIQEAVWDRG